MKYKDREKKEIRCWKGGIYKHNAKEKSKIFNFIIIHLFLLGSIFSCYRCSKFTFDNNNYKLIQEKKDTGYETYISEYVPSFYSWSAGEWKYKWVNCLAIKDSLNVFNKKLLQTQVDVLFQFEQTETGRHNIKTINHRIKFINRQIRRIIRNPDCKIRRYDTFYINRMDAIVVSSAFFCITFFVLACVSDKLKNR